MRLWTLHPRYLDAKGLVALWREALLARAVLEGKTRGYRQHPQLDRFRSSRAPEVAINLYLSAVLDEAQARGYAFDRSKLGPVDEVLCLPATAGQLGYEREHLARKLLQRDPARHEKLPAIASLAAHPLFEIVPGPVETWERGH
jgi:hypothetical protein